MRGIEPFFSQQKTNLAWLRTTVGLLEDLHLVFRAESSALCLDNGLRGRQGFWMANATGWMADVA